MEKNSSRSLIIVVILCLLTSASALAQVKEDFTSETLEAGDSQPQNEDDDASSSTPPQQPATSAGNDKSGQDILTERLAVTLPRNTLMPGQQTQARCDARPQNAQPQVAWSSSSPNLAAVDPQGVVSVPRNARPRMDGEYVDIWARATDGSFAMHCATVLVLPAIRSLTVLPADITVTADDPAMIATASAEISPASLLGHVSIEWVSSDPAIVTVRASNASGELAMITWSGVPGQATITARVAGGSDCSDQITVTVSPAKSGS